MSKQINKPVALAALVSGLALSSSAFAMTDLAGGYLLGTQVDKSAEGKCGEGKCGEGKCGEGKCGVEMIDANKDGKISKAEFAAHMGKPGEYVQYDTNKDGYIDNAEMKVAHEGRCGGKMKAGTEAKCGEGKCGVEKMDTNMDGMISKDEFTTHMGEPGNYTKFDTDKDGLIDNAEMKAAHDGRHGGDMEAGMEGKCGEGKCGGSM